MTIHGGSGCPKPGATFYGDRTIDSANFGTSVSLEGTEADHENWTSASFLSNTRVRRNAGMKRSRLVRNTSGGALLPGDCVKYDTLFQGTRVVAAGVNEKFAGVVDEYLPAAGVKDDDLFWITIRGETMVNKVSTDVLTEAGFLATGAAKNAVTAASVDVDGSHIGVIQTTAGNPTAQVLAYVNAIQGS